MTTNTRPLGENQKFMLRSMHEHHGDKWYAGCGWIWDTHSVTVRMLDSLVKRGLAEVKDEPIYRLAQGNKTYRVYRLTEAGIAAAEEMNAVRKLARAAADRKRAAEAGAR